MDIYKRRDELALNLIDSLRAHISSIYTDEIITHELHDPYNLDLLRKIFINGISEPIIVLDLEEHNIDHRSISYRYMVLDGTHRYHLHRERGEDRVNAIVIKNYNSDYLIVYNKDKSKIFDKDDLLRYFLTLASLEREEERVDNIKRFAIMHNSDGIKITKHSLILGDYIAPISILSKQALAYLKSL
ncbi:MAG: hypothetical protein ARM1_0045 [Candidatus Micrarchaeota archaeon]|nr:MAG: hypothetical protein ARM1_0045 [Candidatus Micrarchaeota archaeon]